MLILVVLHELLDGVEMIWWECDAVERFMMHK